MATCKLCDLELVDSIKKYPLNESSAYQIKICERCNSFVNGYQKITDVNQLYNEVEKWENNIKSKVYDSVTSVILEQTIKNAINSKKELNEIVDLKKEEKLTLIKLKQEEERKYEEIILDELENEGFIVTTADLKNDYDVITPIIFNTTNRGVFSSSYLELCKKYDQPKYKRILIQAEQSHKKEDNIDALMLISLFDSNLFGFEGMSGYRQFDKAFYISLAEMKIRAKKLGGNAIIGLKPDFDLDTTNYGAFYLQLFGTVVKIK